MANCLNIAMHVAAGGVLGGPDTDRVFRDRIERPDQLAGFCAIGFHEAADAVFATIGSDQDLVVDDGRRHRLAVAEFGIGDVGAPDHVAGLGIQRDQLGVERGKVDAITQHLDAAIVWTAAIDGDRSHLVIVVPELPAGLGIERIDVTERRRHEHDAINDDRRSLERFLDVGLEDPGDVQVLDVAACDLLGRIKTRLGVIAVGQKEILAVFVGRIELRLCHRRNYRLSLRRFGVLLDFLRVARSGKGACDEQCGAQNRISIHIFAPGFYHVSALDFVVD